MRPCYPHLGHHAHALAVTCPGRCVPPGSTWLHCNDKKVNVVDDRELERCDGACECAPSVVVPALTFLCVWRDTAYLLFYELSQLQTRKVPRSVLGGSDDDDAGTRRTAKRRRRGAR